MKKLNIKKSILERGGLMIEALAMLGLIAVVTPTMYKKSAERIMEVEDINTASAIRTYMNALNSLVEANYIELMEAIDEPASGSYTIKKLSELGVDTDTEIKKYLPYNYTAASNLYNYGTPEYAVVRSGNNLTAFILFPSKAESADDSIGQERTVRIASLIGSNGGYVRSNTARGVGGIWSIDATDLSNMFDSVKEYSLVTSSIDAINNSTSGAGEDQTKYLQRTKENDELWRNTMRTDIYMGDIDDKNGDDYDDPNNEGYYSIYNINRLMVGADADTFKVTPEGGTETNSLSNNYRGDKDPTTYGLFIADKAEGDANRAHGINAYIAGSVEAAAKKFFVNEKELDYDGPKIQLGKYEVTTGSGNNATTTEHYLVYAHAKGAVTGTTTDEDGNSTDTTAAENLVKVMEDQLVISDEDLQPAVSSTITNAINRNAIHTKVLVAAGGTKGFVSYDENNEVITDDNEKAIYTNSLGDNNIMPVYATAQDFPVMVDSNMMVNGVLAAGQVDTQHLRAASFSAGSANIDDEKKWMDVDKDGVHIHNPKIIVHKEVEGVDTTEGEYDDDGTAINEMEINKDFMAMRFGSDNHNTSTAGQKYSTHDTQVVMDDKNITIAAFGSDIANEPETETDEVDGSVTIKTVGRNAAVRAPRDATNNRTVDITTGTVNEHFEKNEVVIGHPLSPRPYAITTNNNNVSTYSNRTGLPYRALYVPGGFVDMTGTTLRVTDKNLKPILTVGGNSATESGFGNPSNLLDKHAENADGADFKIAMHGNTIFTSDAIDNNDAAPDDVAKYLAMGNAEDEDETSLSKSSPYSAAVNIVSRNGSGNGNGEYSEAGRRIIFIDMDPEHSNAYTGGATSTKNVQSLVSVQSFITQTVTDDETIETTSRVEQEVEHNKRKFDEGAIYIRKGLIDITSSKPGSQYAGVSNDTADEAPGTIRASRFVANNVKSNGDRVTYTSPLKNLSAYQSGNIVQYDTYMVNPAYTSVMKDIKLTSRLGARLSDILPDYITKGIYIATNTIGEGAEFTGTGFSGGDEKLASPYLAVVPAPQCPPGYGRAILINAGTFLMAEAGVLGTQNSGTRLDVDVRHMINMIEHVSSSSDIADNRLQLSAIRGFQAGKFDNASAPLQLNIEYLNDTLSSGEDWTSIAQGGVPDDRNYAPVYGGINGGLISSQQFENMNVEQARLTDASLANLNGISLVIKSIGMTKGDEIDSTTSSETSEYHLETIVERVALAYNDDGDITGVSGYQGGVAEYFLTSNNIYAQPFTIQKSTWLHTATEILGAVNGYVPGWKVLMGFIYPESLYSGAVEEIGLGEDKTITGVFGGTNNSSTDDSSTDDSSTDDNSKNYIWNLFPVNKSTLSAHVTTYCFIDNKGTETCTDSSCEYSLSSSYSEELPGTINTTGNEYSEAGNIIYNKNNLASGYAPEGGTSATVRQRYLNDPALKYNELW